MDILQFAQFDPVTAAFLAAPGIAKGVKGLWNAFNPIKKRRSGLEQRYISQLQRRGRKGAYTPGMQREFVSQTSRAVGQQADIAKTYQQGMVARQGLENSAVATQVGAGIDQNRMAQVAQAARAIALRNEKSKIGAQDQLGQIGRQDSQQQYYEALNARRDTDKAVQGIADVIPTIGGLREDAVNKLPAGTTAGGTKQSVSTPVSGNVNSIEMTSNNAGIKEFEDSIGIPFLEFRKKPINEQVQIINSYIDELGKTDPYAAEGFTALIKSLGF